ncbi:hypothetical protein BH11MYX2_BH11MYX2_04700 [soil metagenome]
MHDAMGEAPHSMEPTPLGIEESRDASGTSWQPESTPMFMWHAKAGGWVLGLHTSSFVGYDNNAGPRGDGQFLSVNWLMGMARRPIGTGDITLRAMLSAEPGTMPKNGYPLLLQTGEAYQGEPLHDRQHPHDLFMELAARYRQPISDSIGFEIYAAPVGEPAIGPSAFPHRFTAMADPLAPLGHHWFDSTHITFGVLTAGVFTKMFKLEGSWFNGREPDENRLDFDFRKLDSASARLSVSPGRDLAAQVSWARLDSPEGLEPDVSVQRLTASATWNHRLVDDVSDVAVTAAVGRNNPSMGPSTNASLVEASLMLNDEHTVFTRVELLSKTGKDLVLPPGMADNTYGMASFSAGYVYDFHQLGAIVPGIGVVGTVDVVGRALEPTYDTRTPVGGMVFVRLRPPVMKMNMKMGKQMVGKPGTTGTAGMHDGHAM